jgi:hypothetical protein
MALTRQTIGRLEEPAWRPALATALAGLGARRVWRAANGDVELVFYLAGWRLVIIDWDIWFGLTLRGAAPLVEALAAAMQPFRCAAPPAGADV